MKKSLLKFLFLFLLAGCAGNQAIVNNIDERDANEIVVFLASKGIAAQKVTAPSTAVGGGTSEMYSITVSQEQTTEAMALLNQYGLPRKMGTNLLTLFAKSGLVSSDREDTIRYQAGLAEELQNTIRKIDGVLDANVQISFPQNEAAAAPGAAPPRITAAVYVKHQGILEDPNSHLEVKIKRLVSASINNLSFDDVSVISDRSRLADIDLRVTGEAIGSKALAENYVSIWGIVLTKSSLARFRLIFFLFTFLLLVFAGAIGWIIYKYYPVLRMKKEKETFSETPPPGS